ncbi:reverse transcriptase domain-containing protein, partial [Tanacetum coccineum]
KEHENRLKPSIKELPKLELKELPEPPEYAFLTGDTLIPVILRGSTRLGYFQIPIAPEDQEKTTFTCPYQKFAYKRMPFGLYNTPETFQRCMMSIFYELIKDSMEVFMDEFSIFEISFDHCLLNLKKMLKRCEETNLILNWEKSMMYEKN